MAWEPLGWKAAWFSEIEPFPNAVLAHRYPDVPNLGDMTRLPEKEKYRESEIDILVGGTPCQSFSIAGLRKGLQDPRGSLALAYCRIAQEKRPRWVVWENVPGVLSSNKGRDFGSLLGALAECGYSLAYRVLNAQYYGVPQRRRRVFVVGHLDGAGDGCAEQVLFDSGGGPWNAPPRRKRGSEDEDFRPLEVCLDASGWESSYGEFSRCLITSCGGRNGRPNHETFLIDGGELDEIEGIRDGTILVADALDPDPPTVPGSDDGDPMTVRRLMPVECERLQGFPDDYTLIPYRGKPEELCPDSPRYRALGNSMAVPVLRWIGGRIAAIEGLPCTNMVQPLDPETVAKALSDSELVEKCVQGFRDLREVIPYLREARNRFAQPGRRVPVPGNPTWTEWVETKFHVTVRRVQQLLKEPSEAISRGSKSKRLAQKLRAGDWRRLLKVSENKLAQVFGPLEDEKELAGAIRGFAQGIADRFGEREGSLLVSVSAKKTRSSRSSHLLSRGASASG